MFISEEDYKRMINMATGYDKVKAAQKKYRDKNKDYYKEYHRKWQQEHRNMLNQYQREWRQRKKQIDNLGDDSKNKGAE